MDVDVNVGCLSYTTGVCCTVPLVGGRIADMTAGRFNTIFASFLILLVGPYNNCSILCILCVVFVALL